MDNYELAISQKPLSQRERIALHEKNVKKAKQIKIPRCISDDHRFKSMSKQERKDVACAVISNDNVTDPTSITLNDDFVSNQQFHRKGYLESLVKDNQLTSYFLGPLRVAILIRSVLPGVITSTYRPTGTHEYGAVDLAPRFAAPHHSALVDKIPLWDIPIVWSAIIPLKAKFAAFGVQVFVEWNHFHIHDEWAARNLVQWPLDYRAPIGVLNVMDQANLSDTVIRLKEKGLINYFSYSFDR